MLNTRLWIYIVNCISYLSIIEEKWPKIWHPNKHPNPSLPFSVSSCVIVSFQGLRFRFWKKIRWPPETVYRPKFHGFPVISTGKSFQIQNSEISVYRPVFRCFSPKNDGNSWKMMGKLCICEKKLKILGSLP